VEDLKIIAVEEHMWTPALRDVLTANSAALMPEPLRQALAEVGQPRLEQMAAMRVDMQVLSVHTPATQALEPSEAVALSREVNNFLAEVVAANPAHYRCFASLPTPDPAAAVDELERCVTELGHSGAMLYGRTGEKFLDHPDFAPLFDKAGELGVPIHLHPQPPLQAVSDAYYGGTLSPMASRLLSTFAWGWHMETAVHAIRLILAGTFERAAAPQIILGHWGEMVPFYLDRIDEVFALFAPGATRGFAETFVNHFHVAPSGIWSYPMLQHAIAVVGADRILFSVDYPFRNPSDGGARRFLEQAPISLADKRKIGYRNAARLLRLDA
jgi:uncharacterized protein